MSPPRSLDINEILHWAKMHEEKTGSWPRIGSGPVVGVDGETWAGIDQALRQGQRGLPGGSSLPWLMSAIRQARHRQPPPPLTQEQILAWADAHHQSTGRWPTTQSGTVSGTDTVTWSAINFALLLGSGGLRGGSSLYRLLSAHRGVPEDYAVLRLTEEQVLAWADAHHQNTGQWPTADTGLVSDTEGLKWSAVNSALYNGSRGLPGGTTLAQLLLVHRGVPKHYAIPRLTEEQVLTWADAHQQRTGQWPTTESGRVTGTDREKWSSINAALDKGLRGLPGGTTLAQLLLAHRGVSNRFSFSALTEEQILAWADVFHQSTGQWPTAKSGRVTGMDREKWSAINAALQGGLRGLPGGTTLAQLLLAHRGVSKHYAIPRLTEELILAWADAHHQSTGQWPTADSGRVTGTDREKWSAINAALERGSRGFRGVTTLAKLLFAHRGVAKHYAIPRLTEELILAWADTFHQDTGRWPTKSSGLIAGTNAEKWSCINNALCNGLRGLPGGASLAKLLAAHREVPNRGAMGRLTEEQILAWADDHHARTGAWPTTSSGPIAAGPGEWWRKVNAALVVGARGLPGGSSLARLLAANRPVHNFYTRPKLSVELILAWADAYYQRIGKWPKATSGPVLEAPGESWFNIGVALRAGLRGLPGGSSLPRLLSKHRGARNHRALPPFRVKQIFAWARAHHRRTGQWPTATSGAIAEVPEETWNRVDCALQNGDRGLPGGCSLHQLLVRHGMKRSKPLAGGNSSPGPNPTST